MSTLRAAPHTSDRHGYRKESAFFVLRTVAASGSRSGLVPEPAQTARHGHRYAQLARLAGKSPHKRRGRTRHEPPSAAACPRSPPLQSADGGSCRHFDNSALTGQRVMLLGWMRPHPPEQTTPQVRLAMSATIGGARQSLAADCVWRSELRSPATAGPQVFGLFPRR